jgi:transglutaminase-like putative cysteine protease
MTVPALAEEAPQPRICNTSEELVEYVMRLAGEREAHISVTIPKTLPEADMGGVELLQKILSQDSGYIRWGRQGGAVTKTLKKDSVTFKYTLTYRTTREQDDAARKIAAGIAAKWELKNLSDREKMGILKSYISKNWRYDNSLKNMTAYAALTDGKATCLGFAMASQLLLNEMGIVSQTVHGTIVQTNTLHIRLIVKLGDLWYTFDPTTLAKENPDLSTYLNDNHGKEFVPDSEYTTAAFRQTFPMTRDDLGAEKAETANAA